MASGSVFSGTLQTITSTKLEELSKQRTTFNKQYDALLSSVKSEKDPLQRLIIVIDGTKLCLGVKTTASKDGDTRPGRVISGGTRNGRLETDLKNVDRFLDQARFDPSMSTDILQDWENKLLRYVSVQATEFQYADLYGKLVTEWLSSEKPATADGDVEMGESFEELPSAKRLEARKEWEKLVFEPATIELPALKAYLERLFITDNKIVASSLNNLRNKIENFEVSLASSSQFNAHTLRWVIKSLQTSDLLSDEKRKVLGDFLNNEVILAEVADVLNMRLDALECWTWGEHAAFVALRSDSQTWQSNRADIPKHDKMRRGFFLGEQGQKTRGNLEDKRSQTQRKRYFTNQLLDHQEQQTQHNEGEEEADFADFVEERSLKRSKQTARKSAPAMQAPARFMRGQPSTEGCEDEDEDIGDRESDDEGEGQDKNPMDTKQGLLHILATEIILNTRLNGELACFRTVFESWNPLMPHDTVLAVLEFFGASSKWNNFFKTFLQAPLKFVDDDTSVEPRLRRRGTPGSHALSDVFGEVVLFCLDFAVNQKTEGGLLHRMYDDVWFWNRDYEKCASAWESVLEFAKVTAVQIDGVKSGSIHIGLDGEMDIDDRLPQGDIRWGFLYVNPSNGRFDIDRKMVDAHISELRKQLQEKPKSIIDWIQVWNSYATTFFGANFGKAANCFGRGHIDAVLATHRHIQVSVFDGGNVVGHLKQMIKDRFNVSNLPDGFLYFPVELGGLELKSPFVGLLQIRNSVKANPYDIVDNYEEQEKDDYDMLKRLFEKGNVSHTRRRTENPDFRPDDADVFFSMEEFSCYREVSASLGKANLRNVYLQLLKRLVEEPINETSQVNQAMQELGYQSNLRGITSSWYSMNAYWK
ncbi:hypothetical protein EJ07DRAFT_161823 [Lizonia empirigonia]|nr:hypothetical protein EJ07DRAFT_161823 [Lizonia empirigonia]